jgi:hypothetical protein
VLYTFCGVTETCPRSKMRECHWKNAAEIEVRQCELSQHSWKLLCPWVKLCRNLRNTVTGLCLSETGTLSRFCKPEGSTIEYKNTCKPEERTPPKEGAPLNTCTDNLLSREDVLRRFPKNFLHSPRMFIRRENHPKRRGCNTEKHCEKLRKTRVV